MAFLMYRRTLEGNRIRYELEGPLRLSGVDGLIARHVGSLPAAEHASWKLDAPGLLSLALSTPVPDGLVVLFDITDRHGRGLCLYELKSIHGSCRDTTTQLAMDFNILVDQEPGGDAVQHGRAFLVAADGERKQLGEMMALSGGPGGGVWRWMNPGMNIGATVVRGQTCPGR
jgi:hypothetical protein